MWLVFLGADNRLLDAASAEGLNSVNVESAQLGEL